MTPQRCLGLMMLAGIAALGCGASEEERPHAADGAQGGAGQDVRGGAAGGLHEFGGGGTAGVGGGKGGGAAGAGMGGFGASPSVPPTVEERTQLLEESRARWNEITSQTGLNYEYRSTHQVLPFGGTYDTWIEVRDGVVVARRLSVSHQPGQEVEVGAAIGRNTDSNFAQPITIEAIYRSCEKYILTFDESKYHLVVTTHDDGVLRSCMAWRRGVADGRGTGYDISEYRLLR